MYSFYNSWFELGRLEDLENEQKKFLMNNLTILVVGSGNISQRHIKNLKRISPHTKIILVKRKKSKSELFIKPDLIVDNYKKYPYEKINAVILANPSSFREKIATYFIKKKNLFFLKNL